MNIVRSLALSGCLYSCVTFAGSMGQAMPSYSHTHPWLAVASIGYTLVNNTGPGTGQSALGRFAVGKSVYEYGERDNAFNPFHANLMDFGIEFGVQNGARLSLSASETELNAFSDTALAPAIQSTLRPMLDFLGTLRVSPLQDKPFFISAKLGLAYRQWQMDVQRVNNISQITGELQAGGGMSIGEAAAISFVYQGIYGSNPKLTFDLADRRATVSNIPQQNGVLMSLSLLL